MRTHVRSYIFPYHYITAHINEGHQSQIQPLPTDKT